MGQGDGPQTFEEFVAARGQQLLRLAYVLTEDAQLAEDIAQTTLLRMHRRWDSIGHPYAYARHAVANGVIDHARRSAREVLVTADALIAIADSTEPAGADSMLTDALPALIQALPKRQRVALVLRYYEHLDVPEISATMGIGRSSVRSAIARALATLRTSLAAHNPGRGYDDRRQA